MYILLLDELGFITEVSSNFYEKYLRKDNIILEDAKINIDEIFIDMSVTSTEGTKKKMIKDFQKSRSQVHKLIDVLVMVRTYQYFGGQLFKEVIFCEDQTRA